MKYVTEPFMAWLGESLDESAVHLPLTHPAYADLLALLSEPGSYTFLTIKDDTHLETVKAWAEGQYILLKRGCSGTRPTKFMYGSCVTTVSPTVYAVINDCCQEDCAFYYNPDAMGGHLGVAFVSNPVGTIGELLEVRVVLSGTLPVKVTVTNAPEWMNVVVCDNMIEFLGTPPVAISTPVQIHAVNEQEQIEIQHELTIQVV